MLAESSSSGAGAAIGIIIIFYLAVVVLFIVGWVKILSKAGYPGWWVLVGIVPLVNLIMFLVFAFSEWPIVREVRELRAGQGSAAQAPGTSQAPGTMPPPPPGTP